MKLWTIYLITGVRLGGMHMINRDELIEELILRENIRRAIKAIKKRKKNQADNALHEEQQLKELIKKIIILEKEAVADPEKAPHSSTGINVLDKLLKNIIPTFEDDFKSLTTDPKQRLSFRAHVLQGIQNVLAPSRAMEDAAGAVSEDLEWEVGDETVSDEDKFIGVRPQDQPSEESPDDAEDEKEKFTIPGEDLTGRNVALKSFNKVDQQIIDSYEDLENEKDQDTFYDYLITNVKLYFDKFEDELAAVLTEPTTPEYEKAAAEAEGEEIPAEEQPEEPPALGLRDEFADPF